MGKISSPSEGIAVEYFALNLPVIYRQNYCCLSNYLPSKSCVLSFLLVDYTGDKVVTRHVDDLEGVGLHLLERYGIFHEREFIGGETEEYCEVGFEQHVLSSLLK